MFGDVLLVGLDTGFIKSLVKGANFIFHFLSWALCGDLLHVELLNLFADLSKLVLSLLGELFGLIVLLFD